VHYCSRACQRAHWKAAHKDNCTPVPAVTSAAWVATGRAGGGEVHGTAYDAPQCFAAAIECAQPADACTAWQLLAIHGGGTVRGAPCDVELCCARSGNTQEMAVMLKALHLNMPNRASELTERLLRVMQKDVEMLSPFSETVDADAAAMAAVIGVSPAMWMTSGRSGGTGTCSPEECFEYAVGLDPRCADAWFELGALQAAEGNGVTAITYFERCLRFNERHGAAWAALGARGGGRCGDVDYSGAQCAVKAEQIVQ
jgi:hypothetical protein